MSTTPGFPLTTIPAFSAPAFSASATAMGVAVTTVTLESTSSSAQTSVPFTFGHAFKQGDLAPGDFLTGRISGQPDVPLQVNVKATHQDGSVRHAVISGVLPSIAAGATMSMALVRVASSSVAQTPIASTSFSSLAAKVVLNFNGATYTADIAPTLAAGISANKAWLAGSIATEYTSLLSPVDAGGVPHPDLQVQFNVRYYPGAAAFKVDITFEHTKPYTAINDLSYSGTIQVGGATVYTLPNPLVHYPCTRWRKTYWVNNAAPLVARHNTAYLIATRQVANYDQRVVVSEATLAGYVTQMADSTAFKPMGAGPFNAFMGETGGRPDIGLLPGYAAATVLSMDKRAIAMTIASGEVGGSWPGHWRDASSGPGAGMPLSAINWPYVTLLGHAGDAGNPSTGQNEKVPDRTTVSNNIADESHQPNFAYLPYLLTGDYFFLEELQFWVCFNIAMYNPNYREHESGLVYATQLRGQGWNMRTLGEAAAIVPDAHLLKSHYHYWVNKNLAWYNARFTDNQNANKIGVIDLDPAHLSGTAVAQWMDDHFTSAIGHVAELGFTEARRLLLWKAKYQVGRLIAPGMCWVHASMYDLKIVDVAGGPVYGSLLDAYNKTAAANIDPYLTPAVNALPCGSADRLAEMNRVRPMPSSPFRPNEMAGYGDSTVGYPANFQAALAMAVDSGYTDGDLAWTLFDGRAYPPDYSVSPQFAIVPRGVSATAPQTPTPTNPQGNATMRLIDLQKQTATVSSAASITLGAVSGTFRTVAQAIAAGDVAAGTTGVSFFVRDPVSGAYESGEYTIGTGGTTLTQTKRTGSSNNGNAVAFGGVACEVYSAAPAVTMNSLLSTGDGVDVTTLPPASTIADADSVFVIQGGTLKLAAAAVMKAYYGTGGSTTAVAPGQVIGLTTGTTTDTTQVLSWTAPSTGTAPFTYKVERSPAGANTWTVAAAAVNALTYTVVGLIALTPYDYRVSATNSVNTGSPSATVTKTTTAAAVQVIGVNNPGPQTVGVTYTASGTYANGTPTALDFSVDGGTNWTAVPSPTIGGGNWSFPSTPSTASASRQMMVRDHATLVYGTSTAYVVNAAATQQIAVATPSAQTVGAQFNVSGTWTVTQPAALDYRLSDDTAGQWTAAPAGVVINANGTYSFPLTPSTASAGRTISVRDRATLVSGTSGTYVVNAAVTPVAYQFNGKAFTEMQTALSFNGGDVSNSLGADFIIKTAAGVAPVDANVDVYAAMSTHSTLAQGMPRPNDAEHATNSGNTFKLCSRIAAGNATYDGYYSYGNLYTYRSYGGGLAARYMWIMVFAKGADPATATPIWAAPYDGNHTGTPIAITVTA